MWETICKSTAAWAGIAGAFGNRFARICPMWFVAVQDPGVAHGCLAVFFRCVGSSPWTPDEAKLLRGTLETMARRAPRPLKREGKEWPDFLTDTILAQAILGDPILAAVACVTVRLRLGIAHASFSLVV